MTIEAVEKWLEEATAGGLLLAPGCVCSGENGGFLISTVVAVTGLPLSITIMVAADFPKDAPVVLLKDSAALGRLPHVFRRLGVVCYSTSEGLLLNRRRPDLVLSWVVKETTRTLEEGLSSNQVDEFMRELEVYWGQLGGPTITNFFNPSSEATAATAYETDNGLRWISQSLEEMPELFRLINPLRITEKEQVTYLPLLTGTAFIPPNPDEPFWNIQQLRELVRPTLEAMTPKRRRQLYKSDRCWQGVLVLAVPLAGNEKHFTLLGISYKSSKGFHPFGDRGADFNLNPIRLKRWERSYLLPRGGGKMNLAEKKVLLIGCGAIGGHLAHELVRAGIQYLTLVDADELSIENMHRHALGMAGVGENKTVALREDLRRKYLYAEIVAIPKSIEQALDTGEVKADAFDLIVAATGEATLERYLNEQLRALPASPPVVYTWLEPYGLGGHALLTWPKQAGCLECLYTSADPDAPLANRALFAAPDQRFSLALSGCGSLHTPYASLDASQTATLAARLVVDALSGRQTTSPLWSWKGDKREFKSAGFKVGPRYKLPEETLRREANAYIAPDCPICGSAATNNNAADAQS